MTPNIRVAAIDDHPIFLGGLERALNKAKGVSLVATGKCGSDALRIAAEHQPDVIILDIKMPEDGIRTTDELVKRNGAIKIIILTGSDNDEDLGRALAAGANGYLIKGVGVPELIEAIGTVYRGGVHLPNELMGRVILKQMQANKEKMTTQARITSLSSRQLVILGFVSKGMTNQEISDKLNLALPTIKNQVSKIIVKIGARNRSQVAIWATENKIHLPSPPQELD